MRKYFALMVTAWMALIAMPVAAEDIAVQQIHHKYRHLELLTPEQVKARFKGLAIVDVRTEYEYQVIHINDAVNIPLYSDKFISSIKSLRASNGGKTIVLYCNGPMCEKAYKAVEAARSHGIEGVAALDSGIEAWAAQYPELTTFLGKSPMDKSSVFTEDSLTQHALKLDAFKQKMQQPSSKLIDLRYSSEAEGLTIFPLSQMSIASSLADLRTLISEAKSSASTLLIYDNSGTTVKWLQYVLEREGVRDYWFLQGGVEAYLNI